MGHAARAFRLELLQLYRSVPSSRVFSHIFRVRVPPERSPIYRNVPPFSNLTPRTIVGSHQTSEGNTVDLALSHGAAWGEETICTMRLKVVVPHRKERGHSNGRYHDWRSWSHPTRRSERRRTLSSEELGEEIRLLPGRQSHRHPVFDHCAVPGGLRELPDPADGGRPGHGFSLREHGELLGLSARGAGPGGELLHAGRSHGLRLDLVPTPSHPLRQSVAGLGHHSDGRLPDPVHHRR